MSWTFALQGCKGEGDEATAKQGTKRWEPWKDSEEIGTQTPRISWNNEELRRSYKVRVTIDELHTHSSRDGNAFLFPGESLE